MDDWITVYFNNDIGNITVKNPERDMCIIQNNTNRFIKIAYVTHYLYDEDRKDPFFHIQEIYQIYKLNDDYYSEYYIYNIGDISTTHWVSKILEPLFNVKIGFLTDKPISWKNDEVWNIDDNVTDDQVCLLLLKNVQHKQEKLRLLLMYYTIEV